MPQKASFYLLGAGRNPDIVAVVSLLDLYGPEIYPSHLTVPTERASWANSEIKRKFEHERFRHFFAVHELEAWLLSQPDIFPAELRKYIQALAANPEEVNFDNTPKKRLNRIFEDRLKRGYQQRIDGAKLVRQLNPDVVRDKCPRFREMIEELINLAKHAGA
jgi:predicted TIM-barrel fold metal-dependent hydrolase